jgi:hypothetical protein
VSSAEQFNHSEHTARIVQDGCELVGGRAFLNGSSRQSYNLQVVGEEIEWVENIRDKKVSELQGEAIGNFRPDEWSEFLGDSAEIYPKLSFVMMQHGHWYQDTDDKPIRRTWATYNDLIPIVKLHTILEHLFAGHTLVVGDAMRKALHQTYVSMSWAEDERGRLLSEDMGFSLTSKLLGANEDGELTATLTTGKKAVLPLFDTIEEDKNGSLSATDDGIVFTPMDDCSIAMEVETRYQTTTAFFSDTIIDNYGAWDDVALGDLSFANQLYTSENADFPFVQLGIEDSKEWRDKSIYAAYVAGTNNWKVLTLYHDNSGAWSYENILEVSKPQYMPLAYIQVTDPTKYQSVGYYVKYAWSDGSRDVGYDFYRPSNAGVGEKNIVRCNLSLKDWQTIKGNEKYIYDVVPALLGVDGNIYVPNNSIATYWNDRLEYLKDSEASFYYLSSEQRLTFDIALKTPTQRYKKGEKYVVSNLYLGCSTYPDKELSVYGTADGSLKPSFENGVAIRESVKLSDVGGNISAEDMLRSIMQLYNLFIYTNPKTRRVHLYSFADFWNRHIVEWSNRIDLDSDISLTAMGDDIGKSVTLEYASGNARIDYFNDRHSLPYFAYRTALASKVATEEKVIANSLFTPAYMVDVKDEFSGGSGRIPAVAEKGKEGNVLDFNLADIPHTLVLIPEGEERADVATLPVSTAVFGDVGYIQPPMSAVIDGVATLSFADSNGIEGLHKHYDKHIALWQKGRRLTCYCRIEPWEIEALRYNDDNINFRSLFRLKINGEDIYGRLESIEYEPTNSTNKCVFIIE